MKALRHWVYMLAANAALFFGLYLWKFKHLEGAGNVVTAWLVFVGVVSLIAGFAGDKSWFKDPRSATFNLVARALTFVIAGVLFFFGDFTLGALCVVGNLCVSVAREREPGSSKKA